MASAVQIIDEAPGTPWAVLAQRELKDGMGLTVEHRFIPPPNAFGATAVICPDTN